MMCFALALWNEALKIYGATWPSIFFWYNHHFTLPSHWLVYWYRFYNIVCYILVKALLDFFFPVEWYRDWYMLNIWMTLRFEMYLSWFGWHWWNRVDLLHVLFLNCSKMYFSNKGMVSVVRGYGNLVGLGGGLWIHWLFLFSVIAE